MAIYKGSDFHDHIGMGEEFIQHYGVMGMKWGVRHYQPYSQVPRKSGKKGTEKGIAKKKTRIGYNEDIRIPKGTKAYRIAVKGEKNKSDRIYLTIDKNDRNMYKAMWPAAMKNDVGSTNKETQTSEYVFKTTNDLISPSAKKRQEIASQLANDPEIISELAVNKTVNRMRSVSKLNAVQAREAVYKAIANPADNNQRNWKGLYEDYYDAIKKSDKDLTELGKADRVLSGMGQSDIIKKKYGEQIVKQGYNMSIDDHGADFPGKVKVNAPIIVYDPDRNIRKIGEKKVNEIASKRAANTYMNSMEYISGKRAQKYYVPNVIKRAGNERNYYDNDDTWTEYKYPDSPEKFTDKNIKIYRKQR